VLINKIAKNKIGGEASFYLKTSNCPQVDLKLHIFVEKYRTQNPLRQCCVSEAERQGAEIKLPLDLEPELRIAAPAPFYLPKT
jgi:hypothetical protein